MDGSNLVSEVGGEQGCSLLLSAADAAKLLGIGKTHF